MYDERRLAMKRILIAADGSEGGRRAVDVGVDLARATQAAVTFLYVRHAPRPIVGDPYYQRALTAELQRARQVVADALAVATAADVDRDYEILEGNPAETILELARARRADLIVVGSRGLGPVAGTLLGSVSSAIVHGADRPVLVTKARVKRRQRAA
jgi:nucleotide-binding universal stress UspA family protein